MLPTLRRSRSGPVHLAEPFCGSHPREHTDLVSAVKTRRQFHSRSGRHPDADSHEYGERYFNGAITIADSVPAGLQLIAVLASSTSLWSCNLAQASCVTTAALSPNQSATVGLSVHVLAGAAASQTQLRDGHGREGRWMRAPVTRLQFRPLPPPSPCKGPCPQERRR